MSGAETSTYPVRLISSVNVSVLNRDDLRHEILSAIAAKRVLKVAFLNTNLANLARRDPELADALRDFLVVNDGLGVDLASWMLYKKKFPQNLVGTDFVPYLLGSPRSLRIYLLGSRMPTLERAASQMKTTWPQHEIVGWHHGYFSLEQEAEISEGIEKLAPDLVLVAMGNVRQEIWIANNVPGACRCGIGVGALLDYIAGDVPRAPAFVRKARSEWLFRMFLEPRRLARRYLVGNTLFLIHLVVSIFQRRSD